MKYLFAGLAGYAAAELFHSVWAVVMVISIIASLDGIITNYEK